MAGNDVDKADDTRLSSSYPDIPGCLKRDENNRAEYMSEQAAESEVTKPVKAPAKPKAKASAKPKEPAKKAAPAKKAEAPKKAKAKAEKGTEKPKAAKPKAEATEKDAFGLRKGSTKSRAAQMYARKSGATLGEVKEVVGSIQLNVLNELEEAGFTVERKKEERKGSRPVIRYWLKPKQ